MPRNFYECDICDGIHPWEWNGDCHEDEYRLTTDTCDALDARGEHYEVYTWRNAPPPI
jgi:hypothetical protein